MTTHEILASIIAFTIGYILAGKEPTEETEQLYHFQGFEPWYAN